MPFRRWIHAGALKLFQSEAYLFNRSRAGLKSMDIAGEPAAVNLIPKILFPKQRRQSSLKLK
jgi:hypothetical protein